MHCSWSWVRGVALGLIFVGAGFAPATAADRWAVELAAFGADDRAHPPASGGVLFVGSSSIRLWTTLRADFPELPAVNRGFGGSQIADVLEHFDVLVKPHAPRLVIFYAGTNDLAAGKPATEVAADFQKFCERLHAGWPGARVIFLSIVTAPARWEIREEMREANRLIGEYCAADARRQFLDVNAPLLAADGQPRGEFFQADQLHLAAGGYAQWRAALAPHLVSSQAAIPVGTQVAP
ncbi:MAG: hypothetical protein C0518_04940 [Opitutus sp.]|nr:hypothetical protein [Opitutus sp.]